MPLLHRGVLLQRERVDPPQHRERTLGGLEPLLLLLADERHRLRRDLVLGHLTEERHQGCRAVVVDQPVGVHAELLERTLLELLDPHLLLRAGHLVAVHGVDQLVVLAAQVAQRGAGCQQLLLALLSGLLHRSARVGRQHHAALEAHQHDGHPRVDGLGGSPLRGSAARGARSPGPASPAPPGPRAPTSRLDRAGRGRAPRWCATPGGHPSHPGGRPWPPR